MIAITAIISIAAFSTQLKGAYKNHHIPDAYIKIAEGMEQEYVKFMLKRMKGSIDKNGPESSAMNYYNSLMTTEQAKKLVQQNGGLGIKSMILDQIYPKELRMNRKGGVPLGKR